jgi:alcohol dehydrogenase (cytochrome c)
MKIRVRFLISLLSLLAVFLPAGAQVTYDRMVRAGAEPQNWLMYSGGYMSQRYSLLRQIDRSNVKNLELKWILPNQVFGAWQATPLAVDGIMYVTQRPNDVLAVDAKTGRVFWLYRHNVSTDARVCCGSNNRGLAMLGNLLFLATLDARLIALDATSGRPVWNVAVADPKLGYSTTMAPLVVKDKVLIGTGGGEYGIRGFIAAYDSQTGKEAWRFYTIPGPGELGHETWTGDTWKTGGGSCPGMGRLCVCVST